MSQDEAIIAQVLPTKVRRSRLLFGPSKIVRPRPVRGTDLYALSIAEGLPQVHPLSAEASSPHVRFVRTWRHLQPNYIEICIPVDLMQNGRNKWNLCLCGCWGITDIEKFINSPGIAPRLLIKGSLTARDTGILIAEILRDQFRYHINRRADRRLITDDVFPARWFNAQMPAWLGTYGLAMTITEIKWEAIASSRNTKANYEKADQRIWMAVFGSALLVLAILATHLFITNRAAFLRLLPTDSTTVPPPHKSTTKATAPNAVKLPPLRTGVPPGSFSFRLWRKIA